MKNIGIIGLGNMGKGMSINLSKRLNVYGYDINTEVFDFLKKENIVRCHKIHELCEKSDVIITMLPNGEIVNEVWDSLLEFSSLFRFLVDCSTIDVKTSISLQKKANRKGLATLDAPVSGGVIGADEGTLTFMVGGNSKTYKSLRFLFDIMGKKSILCGHSGAGQSAKICNNMLLATTMVAVGESFRLGKDLGIDLKILFEVLATSTGSCWAVNTYCPIKGVGPKSPADNNYKGGFSTSLMYKDLGLAMDAINHTNTKVDYGLQTFDKYKKLNKILGHLDFSNIVNY